MSRGGGLLRARERKKEGGFSRHLVQVRLDTIVCVVKDQGARVAALAAAVFALALGGRGSDFAAIGQSGVEDVHREDQQELTHQRSRAT